MSKPTRIIIAGDLFPMPCNFSLFEKGDIQTLFGSRLCEMFASADIRICNLEGSFTDSGTPVEKAGPNIKAPTAAVNAVKELGINFATLGNTHSMDFGTQGYADTCKTLREAGIEYFGWGDDNDHIITYRSFTHEGRRITLYNVTEQFENAPGNALPGVNLYDEYRVCTQLKELKLQSDVLIVFYHGGIEGTHYNSEVMRRRFHRMADNGADVVISQHTHAIGEQETYNGAYLLYGQGNFCFHFREDVTPKLAEGLVLELEISDSGIVPRPHRVLRTEYGCVYDDKQQLEEFYRRSSVHERLLNGDPAAVKEFDEGFGKDCKNWAGILLWAMRGQNREDNEKHKELSPQDMNEYLASQYSRQQLLVMQMFLRNEEFNELGNRIISDMLNETK
jgi:poly-gamma-glutamate synthesis protein (capsule biosynthesis protein)